MFYAMMTFAAIGLLFTRQIENTWNIGTLSVEAKQLQIKARQTKRRPAIRPGGRPANARNKQAGKSGNRTTTLKRMRIVGP